MAVRKNVVPVPSNKKRVVRELQFEKSTKNYHVYVDPNTEGQMILGKMYFQISRVGATAPGTVTATFEF